LLEHRGELVCDALTILRAHALADQPKGNWAPLGSFERWDKVVRGAVHFVTGRDCCATRRAAADEAPARRAKIALLEGWLELGDKMTVATALERVFPSDPNKPPPPDRYPTLRNAIMHYGKDGKPASSGSLGSIIRGMKGNVIENMKFVEAGLDHQAVVWEVISTKPKRPDNQNAAETNHGRGEYGECGEHDPNVPRGRDEIHNDVTTCGDIVKGYGGAIEPDSPNSPNSPPIRTWTDPGHRHIQWGDTPADDIVIADVARPVGDPDIPF
jgi:hypothetical protein